MIISPSIVKQYKVPIVLVLFSLAFYWLFAYYLVRTDYITLIILYTGLFIMFYQMVKQLKHNTKALTYLAFLFRAIFILAIPNLSQDFYRFIWDGRMIFEGANPYLYTVESFIGQKELPVHQALELRAGMGALNASHFSNYPPINQLCFLIAACFSSKSILGSIITMRLIIIAADFGTLHFGKKLLQKLNIPVYNIFWFILNPFIIIELTGNLHFESVMIFFLIWSLYLLHIGKWQWTGVVLALSVSVKLIPLIFLPLFFQWFFTKNASKKAENSSYTGLVRLIGFYAIVLGCSFMLFLPFYSPDFISNYTTTVALWFQTFEFNASIYYLARFIGYTITGYNQIAIIGKILPMLVITFVLGLTFLRRNKTTIQIITAMLLALSFYYFTTTTVHPWYLSTLLILSIFTKYKFPLVWSFMIILSYLAYMNLNSADKSENLLIIALQYIVVYSVFTWEVFIKKAPNLGA